MVQVEISDGLLEGLTVEDDIAGKYYSFRGIPYAAPPINELRFKEPQPVTPWKGVKSAKDYGSPCFQADLITRQVLGSEDCLYLNVFTPEISPSKPLPVMVWIHGGAFLWGSGGDEFYGPELLVRQGVILVTLNYRLGALGFLCLDSADIPGNAGIKDQVAALRWVQKNISKFGGDPDNVTIFGESAGGVSVSYHLVSPMTKGLFKRAITQSGTIGCWWAKTFEHRETAKILAKKLGFYSDDNEELYEFFKKQPVESLINVDAPITVAMFGRGGNFMFTIVDEKDYGTNERFFYGHPYDALRDGIHEGVDVITGYTEDEGVFPLIMIPDINVAFDKINYITDSLIPDPISEYCPASQQVEFGRRLRKHYFGNEKVSLEHLDRFIRFLNVMFSYGTIQWAKIVSSNSKNNKVYLYKFGCKSERNMIAKLLGLPDAVSALLDETVVCHADDLAYLFPMKISGVKIEKDNESFKLIDNVTKLWTNFAKYGQPTPDDSLWVKWLPYNLETAKYLDLGNQLRARTNPDAEEIKFWEDLFREFLPKYVH